MATQSHSHANSKVYPSSQLIMHDGRWTQFSKHFWADADTEECQILNCQWKITSDSHLQGMRQI